MSGYFAYTDETGNTGDNLFDKDQPYFWTGTLISEHDLDNSNVEVITECLKKINADLPIEKHFNEIHANEIGIKRIELIADVILKFLSDYKCSMLFTRLEKYYIANMKLVDTLLDSENNKAIPSTHYSSQSFLLPLALEISSKSNPEISSTFWKVFKNGDKKDFLRIIGKLKWNIQYKTKDKRINELLTDAMDYALKYPDVFLEFKRNLMDAPNVIAFGTVVDYFHFLFEKTGKKVIKFIHDEQNQFAKSFFDTYELIKSINRKPLLFGMDIKISD